MRARIGAGGRTGWTKADRAIAGVVAAIAAAISGPACATAAESQGSAAATGGSTLAVAQVGSAWTAIVSSERDSLAFVRDGGAAGSTLTIRQAGLANGAWTASASNGTLVLRQTGAGASRYEAIAVTQTGGAHTAILGVGGGTGATWNVVQGGAGTKTLQMDNYTRGAVVDVSQSGPNPQSATGIVFLAGAGSTFTLRQR